LVAQLWAAKNGEMDMRLTPISGGYRIMVDTKVSVVGVIKYRIHEIITNFHDRCACPCSEDDHMFLEGDISDFDYEIEKLGHEDSISYVDLDRVVQKTLKIYLIDKKDVVYPTFAEKPFNDAIDVLVMGDSGLPVIPNLIEISQVKRAPVPQSVLETLEMVPSCLFKRRVIGLESIRNDDRITLTNSPLSNFSDILGNIDADEQIRCAKERFGSNWCYVDPLTNISMTRTEETKDVVGYVSHEEPFVGSERQIEAMGDMGSVPNVPVADEIQYSKARFGDKNWCYICPIKNICVVRTEATKDVVGYGQISQTLEKTSLKDVGGYHYGDDWCDYDPKSVRGEVKVLLCKQCDVKLVEGINCSKTQFRKGHKCSSCVIPPPRKVQKVIYDTHTMQLDRLKGKKSNRLLAIDFEVNERDRKTVLEMGITYMSSCCSKIISQHYIVDETVNCNGRDLSHSSEFAFGVTSFVTLDVVKSILERFIEAGYVLISCDSRLETKVLFDLDFKEFSIVDLQLLDDRYVQARKALKDYCCEYSIHAGKLHNAGNDAYAIFQVMFSLLKRLSPLIDTIFEWGQYNPLGCQMCAETCVERYLLKIGCVSPEVSQGFYVQVNKENFKRYMLSFDDCKMLC